MNNRSLKIILESDVAGIQSIMGYLFRWLDSALTERKIMYIEQIVGKSFAIPDEEPLTREREMRRAFNHGFKAAHDSPADVYQEDIENAWLESKKALL